MSDTEMRYVAIVALHCSCSATMTKESLSRVGRNCDPQANDLKSQVNLQCFHCIHDQVTDRQKKVSAGSDLEGGHLRIDFGNSRLTSVWIKTSHELFRH